LTSKFITGVSKLHSIQRVGKATHEAALLTDAMKKTISEDGVLGMRYVYQGRQAASLSPEFPQRLSSHSEGRLDPASTTVPDLDQDLSLLLQDWQ